MNQKVIFLVCVLGTFLSYFVYGVMQEKVFKTKHKLTGANFSFVFCLLFIQCVVNSIIGLLARTKYEQNKKKSYPTFHMMLLGFTYIGAMVASNSSLKFVNYPTQVIGKSIKPIPVMLFSVLWARKSYPLKKYFFVLLITIGVMLFMYKDQSKSSQWDFGYGEVLLLLSLALDGVTGGIQQGLVNQYNIGSYNLMFSMNFWSLIFLSASIYIMDEFRPFIEFIRSDPSVLTTIGLFGISSASGQVFLFNTITKFGPLTCSIVTTTRKFFTVLGSVIIYRNPLSQNQWIGAALVFLGLILDQVFGKSHHHRGGSKAKKETASNSKTLKKKVK